MLFYGITWWAMNARQRDAAPGSVTLSTTTASTPPPAFSWAPPADAQPFARLDDLVARTGTATEAEAEALTAATPPEKLVARGATVATPRVAADALRIFGRANLFFQGAPKALVDVVRLSPEVIRIGAWTAREAERRDVASRAQAAGRRAQRGASADVAKSAAKEAQGAAAQLADALYNVAGADAHAVTRITKATQPAAEGHAETGPGRVLAALVAEGRTLVASKDAGVVTRRKLFRLDAAYLDDCARLAERARDATRTAGAPAVAAGRSHAEVDLWDGRALALADIVVAAFAKAHAVDARVPKLAYVSLRDRSGDKGKPGKKPAKGAPKDPAKPVA